MAQWTESAQQELETYLTKLQNITKAEGADPDEVNGDIREHLNHEIREMKLDVVTREDVVRILSRMDAENYRPPEIVERVADSKPTDRCFRLRMVYVFLLINITGLLLISWQLGWDFSRLMPGKKTPLVIESTSIKDEMEPLSDLSFTFNKELSAASLNDRRIRLIPSVKGETVIRDDCRLVFQPEDRLIRGVRYTVVLPQGITASDGTSGIYEHEYAFTVNPLIVIDVSQADFKMHPDPVAAAGSGRSLSAVLQIEFNDRVNSADIMPLVQIHDDKGNAVPARPVGSVLSSRILIETGPVRRDRICVKIAASAKQGSLLRLGEAFTRNIVLASKVGLVRIRADWDSSQGQIVAKFNTTMDIRDARRFIRITPAVDFTVGSNYRSLRIQGDFKPGERYKIRFGQGLPSTRKEFLIKDVERTVWFPDKPRYLSFKYSGQYLSSRGSGVIPVVSTNIKEFSLSVYRLVEENIVYHATHRFSSARRDLSEPVAEHVYQVEAEKNSDTQTRIQLKELLGANTRGVFSLRIYARTSSGETRWAEGRQYMLVCLSDIGISCKQGPHSLLVWVNSLVSARPLENAEVCCYTYKNQLMARGRTNSEGVAEIALADSSDKKPNVLILRSGTDLSYYKIGLGGNRNRDVSFGRDYISEGYEAVVWTERGIYRPGEDVHVQALVRDGRWKVPGVFPVTLTVYKPGARRLIQKQAVLDRQGGVGFDVRIPRYEMSGVYEAVVSIPGTKRDIGRVRFQVRDFMPRRIEGRVDIADKRFDSEEQITFHVLARHLYGAPAAGLRVQCRAVYTSEKYKPESRKYQGFVFCDSRGPAVKKIQHLSDKRTDGKGSASFSLRSRSLDPGCPLRVHLHPVVLEKGNRPTPLYASVMVDPYDFYYGIRPGFERSPKPGKKFDCDLVALRPTGEPVNAEDIQCTVRLVRHEYANVLKKEGDYYRYKWIEEMIEMEKKDVVLRKGAGSASFHARSSGRHSLIIEGGDGCTAVHSFYVFGNSRDSYPMTGPASLSLELDQKTYKPGDIARLKVNSAISGRMLVTVESDRIISVRTMNISKASRIIDIPVTAAYMPNVYVGVTVVAGTKDTDIQGTYRLAGACRLRVNCDSSRLKLDIRTNESVRPKEELKITVQAQAGSGPAAGSRICLAVVDEGVLQVNDFQTPDLFDFFYGIRRNPFSESDMYGLLLPEVKGPGSKSAPGGGGPVMARRLSPVDARRVRIVSITQAPVFTGPDGIAEFSVNIPEYHGKLRVMAFAARDETFGSAQQNVRVRSPIMAEASLPRFLAPGDRCSAIFTLTNKTETDGNVRLSITTHGPVVRTDTKPISVFVKAGGEKTVPVPFAALENCAVASIRYTAEMGPETYSGSLELPVRPARPVGHLSGCGTIQAPGRKTIQIPGNWFKGTEKSQLTVGAYPAIKLSASLDYLLGYPYGCVEQTTSRLFPLLYLPELVRLRAPENADQIDVRHFIEYGIYRLYSMQTYRGGLAYWPGGSREYDFGSVYAADFLLEAQQAGYPVSENRLNSLLKYLERTLNNGLTDENRGVHAYIAYVLTRARRTPRQWLLKLEENRDKLKTTARCHLANALFLASAQEDGLTILRQTKLAEKVGRMQGGYLASGTRAMAVYLNTLMQIKPADSGIHVLAAKLVRSAGRKGRWSTTQENAWALMVLGKYARTQTTRNNWTCRLRKPDGSLSEFTHEQSITLDKIEGSRLTLELEGQGALYYSWQSSGVAKQGAVQQKRGGISISREFLETGSGERVRNNKFTAGSVYIARLHIQPDMDCRNLVVSDLLPAGLEIEDVAAHFKGKTPDEETQRLQAAHCEKRDDRILIFADTYGDSKYIYDYVIRAVTPGAYALPALEAECMYDSDICFVGAADTITVVSESGQ